MNDELERKGRERDSCQSRLRLPSARSIFVATIVLVLAWLPLRSWLLYERNKHTLEEFLRLVREENSESWRMMLEDDHSDWVLYDHWLRKAADQPLIAESGSLTEFATGRQRFRFDLRYIGSHHISVCGGRVDLEDHFWMTYIPPAPEFKLTRPVDSSEESPPEEQNPTDEAPLSDEREPIVSAEL